MFTLLLCHWRCSQTNLLLSRPLLINWRQHNHYSTRSHRDQHHTEEQTIKNSCQKNLKKSSRPTSRRRTDDREFVPEEVIATSITQKNRRSRTFASSFHVRLRSVSDDLGTWPSATEGRRLSLGNMLCRLSWGCSGGKELGDISEERSDVCSAFKVSLYRRQKGRRAAGIVADNGKSGRRATSEAVTEFYNTNNDQLCSVQLQSTYSTVFAAQCYASAAYAVMRRPSVCLSRSWILSKRINIIKMVKIFSPSGS